MKSRSTTLRKIRFREKTMMERVARSLDSKARARQLSWIVHHQERIGSRME